ncbi:MAG TPA: glycosyltransferase family 39 protein [Chthonomonadales bacterium]|nr:glycosyltransferase family 39 protein [Chthonomonadales bacterium]
MNEPRPSIARELALLAAVCYLAFWWQLGANGVWDLDEGLYAASAREMLLTGDWVTPRVNGVPFFEKPPLAYWAAAASMAIFGRSEWSLRVPSALAGTLAAFLTWWIARRLFGRGAGLPAGVFFALAPLVLGTGRMLTMDALLTLSIAAALACWLVASEGRRGALASAGFWAACGIGVLAKGLVGALLPLLIVSVHLAVQERLRLGPMWAAFRVLRPGWGAVVLLAVAAPWHVAAWRAEGAAFVDEYLVRQHFGRFRGGDIAHRAPFWFFVPALLAGAFPWSGILPAALTGRWSRALPRARQASLLRAWFWVVFLFFSASGSKLVSYILPCFPAAAALAGGWLAATAAEPGARRAWRVACACAAATGCLLLAASIWFEPLVEAVARYGSRPVPIDDTARAIAAAVARLSAVAALAGVAALALAWMDRRGAAVGALSVGMAAFAALAVRDGLTLAEERVLAPLHGLASEAGARAAEGAPLRIVIAGPRRPSVLFYLPDSLMAPGRRVVEDGDVEQAISWLRATPGGLALTDARRAASIGEAGAGTIVMQRGGWALVSAIEDAPGR